jgi:serine/threonine protein kinase
VCLKLINVGNQRSWIREAYFGELLAGHPRAIQVLDAFPHSDRKEGREKLRYCLALELAEHGDVAQWLEQGRRSWSALKLKREIVGLLHALDRIHGGGAVHRDLTPFNVLVCRNETLKLGDFGLARHGKKGGGVNAGTFNMGWVPPPIRDAEQDRWRERDDIYQMGQLLASLVQGEAAPISTRDVKTLACGPELKAVIRRAIGEPGERYRDALEMIAALEDPASVPTGGVTRLRGKQVAFTGRLSMPRREAARLVTDAGGKVSSAVTTRTEVLVRGVGSPAWIADDQGRKLLAAVRIRERGGRIRVINESRFLRLVRPVGG